MRQILFAGVIGMFLTVIGTPLLIKLLARKGYGQFIRDDGPRGHAGKKGTPTMGGISFILATLIAYALTKVITGEEPSFSGLLVLFLMAGMGLVGYLDDYIKIVKRRSLGLRAKAKMSKPADRRHRLRGARAPVQGLARADPGLHQAVVRHGLRLGDRPGAVRGVGPVHDPGHVQRREPDGRPGRPGHGRRGDGLRCVHLHRCLAAPGVLCERAGPDQPGGLFRGP